MASLLLEKNYPAQSLLEDAWGLQLNLKPSIQICRKGLKGQTVDL